MTDEPSNETVLRMQVLERLDAILLGIRAVCALLVLAILVLIAVAGVLFLTLQ